MSRRDEIVCGLESYLVELGSLIESPRRRFSALAERDVPESAGLYVIYREEPFEVFYVGKASRRANPSASGQPDGLRFRIMKNHLAYQGNDNFVRYVMEEFGLAARADARRFIQDQCSVHWVETGDPQQLFVMEHLAIASLRPRLNRG
jgi:hypothetical protein